MRHLKPWLLGLLAVVGFMCISQSYAAAASWCAVLAPANNPSNCMASGQDYTTCTVLNGTFDQATPTNSTCGNGETQAQLKATFINHVKNFASSGQYFQKVGANAIIAGIYRHSDMSWDQRINQPDVYLTIGNVPFNRNTAYDPGSNSIVNYADSDTHYSVVFRIGSKTAPPVYEVKLDCGNFEATLPGLPQATWNLASDTWIKVGSGGWTQTDQTVTSVGTNINFKHEINDNAGPDDAVGVNWQVEGCYFNPSGGSCTMSTGSAGGSGQGLPGPNVADIPNNTNGPFPKCWPSASYDCPPSSAYNFSMHSSPKDGDKYCQTIYYQNDTGPNDNSWSHSNRVCVTLQLNNNPSGSIGACVVSGATGTITATFSDADGSSTYKLTGTLSTGLLSQSNTVSATTGTVTLTVPVPVGGATYTVNLKVPDVGPGSSGAYTNSKPVTCSNNPPPSGGCPSFTPSTRTVNLSPQNVPASTSDYTDDGYSDNPSQVAYTYTPNGNYKIDDVTDGYQSATKSDGSTGWNPTTETSNSNAFTIYYDGWIKDYPYDDHTITVKYETYYDTQKYVSAPSTSPTYYCPSSGTPSGGSLTSSTCSYDASSSSYCPSGSSLDTDSNAANYNGGTAARDALYNHCVVYQHADDYGSPPYACKTYTDWGSGCYSVVPFSTSYSCPSSGTPSGGTLQSDNTCQYSASAKYKYTASGAAQTDVNVAGSTSAPTLPECYPRNFDVQSAPQTDMQKPYLQPSYESPTSAHFGANINVIFTLRHGGVGVHDPLIVNGLTYNGTYYYAKAAFPSLVPFASSSQTFNNVGGSTNVSIPGTASYSIDEPVSVPPLAVGDEVCGDFTVTPAGYEVDHTGTIVPATKGGVASSTKAPALSTCSSPVQNNPYTRSYGGDVLAGAQLPGGGCNGNASIIAARGSNGVGSGTQFAALGLGQIQGYASAFLRTVAPIPATGLSFANNTGGDGGYYAGPCTPIRDYFALDLPAAGSPLRSDHPITSIGIAGITPLSGTHVYYSSTGGQFNGGMVGDHTAAPGGSGITIFVDGDVYISNDIYYDTAGWTWDPNTRSTNVPSFYLIVRGTIDVDPNVRNLDGVYVALPKSSGGGGVIRTCSQSPSGGPINPASNLFSACSKALTVHGAFIAQDVLMDRSYQSIRYGTPGENIWGGPQNAAEVYDFGPELFLGNPALNPTGGPTKNEYDAITGLSPVL